MHAGRAVDSSVSAFRLRIVDIISDLKSTFLSNLEYKAINIRAFILPRCRYCAPRTKNFRNEGKHSDVRFRFDDRNDDLNQVVFHSISSRFATHVTSY